MRGGGIGRGGRKTHFSLEKEERRQGKKKKNCRGEREITHSFNLEKELRRGGDAAVKEETRI